MTPETYNHIVKSIWVLAGKGLENLTIDKISTESQVEERIIRDLFPQQHNILLALLEDLNQKVNLPEVNNQLTSRDQIFDAVMTYFDEAHPHQAVLKKLSEDLVWAPFLLLHLLPRLYSLGESISDKYLPGLSGVMQSIHKLALNAAFTRALFVFLDDDSFDLSKTMTTLDQTLKTVDGLSENVKGPQ